MGRSRRDRRFFLFNHPFSRVIMDWFLSLHFSHQFKLFCHLTCETIWSWVWSKLCLEKLDLIVVEIFLWFFITWSSLLLIIHIHVWYRVLTSYLSLGDLCFDYFILVTWHHLLLCEPCLCQIFHVSARRSLLVSLRLLGESANVFGISAAFAIVEMSRGGVTGW